MPRAAALAITALLLGPLLPAGAEPEPTEPAWDLAGRAALLDAAWRSAASLPVPLARLTEGLLPFLPPPAWGEPQTAAATGLPTPPAGETTWINDTTVHAGSIVVQEGAHLILQNTTILFADRGRIRVEPGGQLAVLGGSLRPEGAGTWWLDVRGAFEGRGVAIEGAAVSLRPGSGQSALLAEATVVRPAGSVHLVGAEAALTGSLVTGRDREAVRVEAGARAEGNTLVGNAVGVMVGGGGVARGNEITFNLFGVWWNGEEGAVVTGNNIHNNYVDGLYGNGKDGATLEATGNWWDGSPNLDGDTFGGAGVTAPSPQTSRHPIAERTADLGHPLHVIRSTTTWNGPFALDGHVLVRSGTLTIQGGTVDGNGFLLGSHAGASLRILNADVEDYGLLVSRGSDLFDGVRITSGSTRGADIPGVAGSDRGVGIAIVQGTATVRRSSFEGTPVGVAQVPRSLVPPDHPVGLTVEDSSFSGSDIAILAAISQPTIRGNTVRSAEIGIVSALCASVTFQDNLVQDSGIGLADVLSQGFTGTGNAAYNSVVGLLLALTTSPTLGSYEGRFNGINVAVIGSQVTLTGSNVYDNPLYGVLAAPFSVEGVSAPGKARIDPTTYVGDSVHGDVEFLPPRKAAPAPPPGRTAAYDATIVGPGQSLHITGPWALTAPLIVRAGGTLRVEDAEITGGLFAWGAQEGSTVRFDRATVRGGAGFVLHTSDAAVRDSTFEGALVSNLVVADTAPVLERNRLLDAPVNLLLADSRATVKDSFFRGEVGIEVWNDTWPRRGHPVIERSWFEGRTGIRGSANPDATVRRCAFASGDAIDAQDGGLLDGARTGSGRIDARESWYGHASGPGTPQGGGSGAKVRWQGETPLVLISPWLTASPRSAFDGPVGAVTDAQELNFRDTSFALDGRTLSRAWDFGDGSAARSEAEVVHQFERFGDLTVTLTVEDAHGWTSVSTRTVTVKAAPRAALQAPAEATSLDEVVLDASASHDPDGEVTGWRFVLSDGTDTGFLASPILRHAFPRPGPQTATVAARDDEGHVGLAASAVIEIANRAPSAAIGLPSPPANRADPVALRHLGADPDGTIVGWEWTLGDGNRSSEANPLHRYERLGTYPVDLTVTDDFGATATASVVVVVENLPPPAMFTVTPRVPRPGQPATLTSTGVDLDGGIVAWVWSLGLSGREIVHTFPDVGSFPVTLTVTDADGEQAAVTIEVVISDNDPPVPAFSTSPAKGDTSTVFRFTDASWDGDGQVIERRWDFGDGGQTTGTAVTHRFLNPGVHTVRLTVVDDKGGTATTDRTVTVDDALDVVVTLEPRVGPEDPVFLRVRTQWENGTGVSAQFKVIVRWGPLTPVVPWYSVDGQTPPGGETLLRVRPPAGSWNLDGRYFVTATALVLTSHGGNSESVTRTFVYEVRDGLP